MSGRRNQRRYSPAANGQQRSRLQIMLLSWIIAASLCAMPAVASTVMPPVSYRGTIIGISDRQVGLLVSTEIVSLNVDGKTEVVLDGARVRPGDLRPGDQARATASTGGGLPPLALRIDAHRAK